MIRVALLATLLIIFKDSCIAFTSPLESFNLHNTFQTRTYFNQPQCPGRTISSNLFPYRKNVLPPSFSNLNGPTIQPQNGTESPASDLCFDGGCSIKDDIEIPKTKVSKNDGFNVKQQFHVSERLEGWTGPTVWSEFQGLAAETGGVNLGQGYPNWDPPAFVVEAAQQAVADGFHQYTRTSGHPRLVEHLAERYSRHMEREIDPINEIAITVGASQALYITMQALLRPGDEVILLEPFFDLYIGQIRLSGAVPKFVPLQPCNGQWEFDPALLREAMTDKTRAIVINTPHNPTGKVFTREELESIADIVREYPKVVVISDEVYKYIIHSEPDAGLEGPKPAGHVHFANLPGMWDRTVTLSSAGKTFSVTGWSIGWIVAPVHFTKEVQTMLPYMQFCASTPMQEAMVHVLRRADQPYEGFESYYHWMRHVYSQKKQLMIEGLKEAGIEPIPGQGGFFIVGDTGSIEVPEEYLQHSTPAMPKMTRDWAFCRWMALEHGVIAIPTSPFFSKENRHLAGNYVRFAFCKKDETIFDACQKMKEMVAGTRNLVSLDSHK